MSYIPNPLVEVTDNRGQKYTADVFSRLLKERMSRPLIKEISDEELKRYIIRKLSERKMYYEQADITVNEESITLEELIR